MNWITPYRLSQEERPHIRALHMALVKDLYDRGRVPVLVLTFSLVILWALLRGGVAGSPWLKGLFPCLVVVLLLRSTLVLQGDRLLERHGRIIPRFRFFLAGVLATGVLLGALALAAFNRLEPGHFLILCLYLMAICAISTVSMAGSPLCFAAMLVPAMGGLFLGGIIHPPFGLGLLFSGSLLVCMGTFLHMSSYVHASLCRNVLLAERLGDLALRDPLTGLRNRRYLGEFMQEETVRVLRRWLEHGALVRTRRSISLIMVDLDHFKQVNDQYGHAAGDALLVQVAKVLREVVRKPDMVLRWGGEEFLILALDSDRIAPPLIAVRLHERLAQHPFILPGGETYHQTASVGFAIYPFHPLRPEGLDWIQVLRMADDGLYRAKEGGRNRIHGVLPGTANPDLVMAALNQPEPDFEAAAKADFIRLI